VSRGGIHAKRPFPGPGPHGRRVPLYDFQVPGYFTTQLLVEARSWQQLGRLAESIFPSPGMVFSCGVRSGSGVGQSWSPRPREGKENPFPNISTFHPLPKGLMSPGELRMIFSPEWGPRKTSGIIQGCPGHSYWGCSLRRCLIENQYGRVSRMTISDALSRSFPAGER
jgi:hypothetical protein